MFQIFTYDLKRSIPTTFNCHKSRNFGKIGSFLDSLGRCCLSPTKPGGKKACAISQRDEGRRKIYEQLIDEERAKQITHVSISDRPRGKCSIPDSLTIATANT